MEVTIKHSVKAYLYDNLLTDDPNDFSARVSSERTLGIEDICQSAVSRGGADVSAKAMSHAVDLFLKEMAYLMCDGYSVNTGYFTAGVQIKGVFNNPKEPFTKGKHTVSFLFNQGDTLRKELSNVDVAIMGVAETGCEILQVTDVKTGSVNDVITPGRNLKIRGSKIKLAGETNLVGVYFLDQASGNIIKVDVTDVVTNNPSELMVVVPELAAGVYVLEVRTKFSGGSLLKEVRVASFDKTLRVV
ncbi:MAG: DNA-binding domain-containing protein [Breznakibacter sp.]